MGPVWVRMGPVWMPIQHVCDCIDDFLLTPTPKLYGGCMCVCFGSLKPYGGCMSAHTGCMGCHTGCMGGHTVCMGPHTVCMGPHTAFMGVVYVNFFF